MNLVLATTSHTRIIHTHRNNTHTHLCGHDVREVFDTAQTHTHTHHTHTHTHTHAHAPECMFFHARLPHISYEYACGREENALAMELVKEQLHI